jgi:3-methyl-2-oxobutanoate hydroxymethyltransferase
VHFERRREPMSVTVRDVRAFKERSERFVMLTAYDFPTARILDEAGIPILLVGDSVADNELGYPNTLPVTMEEMLHHTRAVARGATNALIVGDMPFMSYQASLEDGIRSAGRFLKEGGANAVKVEGAVIELTAALVERGIPVMGHLGLTPQSVNAMGGFRVQGRTDEAVLRLLDHADALSKAGAFAIVLEAMPADVGKRITESVEIPTIGIGAGPHCDAQVLVINDLLGLGPKPLAKLARAYADLRGEISRAASAFADDVRQGRFPDEEHSYH